jgi:hypothetical protein
MEAIAAILMLIAIGISLIFGVMVLIKAFQKSIWWGLGSIFVPFVYIIFLVNYWEDAKDPFLKSLISIPIFIVAILLMPGSIG